MRPLSRVARQFKSPDLRLPLLALVAIAPGLAAAAAAGFGVDSLVAGLVSVFVVVAAVAAPRPLTLKAGLASGAIVTAGLLLAHVTGSQPVASGLAMAFVALLTGIAVAGGPVAAIIGSILGTAYFLPASLSLTENFSTRETVELTVLGLAAGLLMVVALMLLDRLRGPKAPPAEKPDPEPGTELETEPQESDGPLVLLLRSAMHGGPERRYGIRRALLLGVGMGIYQATDDHNVFWVMMTIFIVLLPDMERTWSKALARSSGAILGAFAVGALAQVLPPRAVVTVGVAAMVASLAYYRRNYAIYTAGLSFLVIAMLGEQQGDFLNWAILRAGDTLIGAAIALAAVYLVLPERKRLT